MPNGYVREQFESTPGNETNSPTASTKKLFPPIQSFAPHLGAEPLSRDDELRNQDEPLAILTDAYNPTWEYTSRGYPDLLGWRLCHSLGKDTGLGYAVTAGNGVITDPDAAVIPTGATRHVWTAPFGPSGASPLTTQVEVAYKDQSTFFRLKGAAQSDLGIESPETGGMTVTASGPANYMSRISDPSLTPTYEALAVRPFTRGNLTLTWLTGSGTTQDFSLAISNPVENARSLGIASKFPDIMEKSNEGPIVVSGSIPKRQLDPDDWDALLNATGFAGLARWVSDTNITGSYPYKLYVSMSNCQYTGGDPDALANQRRHGASFDWKSTTASTGSTTVTLINGTASYA